MRLRGSLLSRRVRSCSLPHGSGQLRKPSDSSLLAYGRARRRVFLLRSCRFFFLAGCFLVFRSGQQCFWSAWSLGSVGGFRPGGLFVARLKIRSGPLRASGCVRAPPVRCLALLAVAR